MVTTSVLSIFHGDGKGNFASTGTYGASGRGESLVCRCEWRRQTGPDSSQRSILPGNGDGTFQAPPATPIYGLTADVNNDGIADMVFSPPLGGNVFGTALGRGDGTFAILDQTTTLSSPFPFSLMLGDFNGDGKVDTLAIQYGNPPVNALGCTAGTNSQLLTYLGSGDGRFQAKGTGLALGVQSPGAGISGDFNSDGKLDLVLPVGSGCQPGLLFVPGNGDGTFGAPVNLNASQSSQNQILLAGDLNNDKKLDFIWGNAVFLGNGDGTFKQIPLSIAGSSGGNLIAVALADLNGDGTLDAVSGSGVSIYAGNGDGTFQTTPFFSQPDYTARFLASGDVNGDGNPDLLTGGATWRPSPYTWETGTATSPKIPTVTSSVLGQYGASATVPTRLNNQAPALPNDNRLDLLLTDRWQQLYVTNCLC